ncbi:NAD(P)-dependent oxidoreductase [Leifsonia sp. H3M29-4]|uniref:NAD(P)-dependent oxidoreductase n=1 Tax=Salinibacterium metalliresistens TaxID=3031321 RepID=UPI0023DA7F1A|nr:NAD(P)-dependent oxidoreductase [Salinibacterium metalliresistens]MDF1480011.1 NAD(P)-dependent oxidoreductase [Salinibacterium metalliresistens]
MSEIAAIGFVGLGNMGMPIVKRLLAAGYQVTGFDVAPEARAALAAAGGRTVETLGEVVEGADALILMLPDSTVVGRVMSDPALRAGLRPGLLVVDMGSSEPVKTRALAADLDALGVGLVDAPVSGGVSGAVQGALTVMVGGGSEAVSRVTPVLEHLGRVRHAGPVGSGHAIKALNNLISATHLWITSEAMLAGQRFGLQPEVMLEIINGSSGRSGSSENKWPNFILPGTFDSGFGLRLMLKDMRTATDLAAQLGIPIELGDAAVNRWSEAAQALPPTADHTEVAKWLAEEREV